MRKIIIMALAVFVVFATVVVPADAQDKTTDAFIFRSPDDAKPAPVIPVDWVAVAMWGDVWANGIAVGPVDFVLFWQGDYEADAQLWAIWRGEPVQLCVGKIFDTPDGEPIFFGEARTPEAKATCHMARTPDLDEISLFIADENGQWANAIMTSPEWQRAGTELILD